MSVTNILLPGNLERVLQSLPGGVKNKVLFTPVDNIASIGALNPVTKVIPSVLLNGVPWMYGSFPDPGKGIDENSKKSEKGDFVETIIKMFLPFYKKENQYALTVMAHHRWVVLVRLRDGQYRIFGTKENGLYMDFAFSTGDAGKDVGGAVLTFRWESQDVGAFVTPGVVI